MLSILFGSYYFQELHLYIIHLLPTPFTLHTIDRSIEKRRDCHSLFRIVTLTGQGTVVHTDGCTSGSGANKEGVLRQRSRSVVFYPTGNPTLVAQIKKSSGTSSGKPSPVLIASTIWAKISEFGYSFIKNSDKFPSALSVT